MKALIALVIAAIVFNAVATGFVAYKLIQRDKEILLLQPVTGPKGESGIIGSFIIPTSSGKVIPSNG